MKNKKIIFIIIGVIIICIIGILLFNNNGSSNSNKNDTIKKEELDFDVKGNIITDKKLISEMDIKMTYLNNIRLPYLKHYPIIYEKNSIVSDDDKMYGIFLSVYEGDTELKLEDISSSDCKSETNNNNVCYRDNEIKKIEASKIDDIIKEQYDLEFTSEWYGSCPGITKTNGNYYYTMSCNDQEYDNYDTYTYLYSEDDDYIYAYSAFVVVSDKSFHVDDIDGFGIFTDSYKLRMVDNTDTNNFKLTKDNASKYVNYIVKFKKDNGKNIFDSVEIINE